MWFYAYHCDALADNGFNLVEYEVDDLPEEKVGNYQVVFNKSKAKPVDRHCPRSLWALNAPVSQPIAA